MTDAERPEAALEGMDLEAGLEAAFEEDEGAPSTCQSVLAQLAEDGQDLLPVLLKDPDSEEDLSPVVRPGAVGIPVGRGSRYQLVGEIARGGVGIVLKGHDVDLGRDVAMKVIREDHRDNPDVVQRFVEEAQIGSQLQHPGVVPVYEIGIGKDKRPYFTMKLVKGKTLSALLSRRASPARDRRRFLSIFEAICQTLGYAHARGVIHRDLKPSNVMVGAFGEVLVVDWGMGKVLRSGGVDDERTARHRADQTVVSTHRSGGDGSQSVVGSVIGTPRYMAPEQARGDLARVDERTDVFGLGAILCEILTGKPPYVGDDAEIIRQAAGARLEGAEERLAACGADPELIELARGCLSPAPEGRPENARALAEQIGDYLSAAEERVQESKLAAARAEERAEAESDRAEAAHALAAQEQRAAAHARRARRLTVALASLAVLVVLGGAAFWLNRQSERAAAEAATADLVSRALERGELLAEQAETSQDLETWDLVILAVEDAARLLAAGEGGGALRARVESARQKFGPRAEAAREVRERMARAKTLILEEDAEGALAEYEAVVSRMPEYAAGHKQMAVVYKVEGQIGDAVRAYRRAVKHRPTSESLRGLARAIAEGGDGAAALRVMEEAVERFPNDPAVHNTRAIYLPDEDWPGKIAAYRAALRVDPSCGPARFNLTNLYDKLVEAGERRVLAGDLLPPDGRWRVHLARRCADAKRFPDALRLYELAFEANPRLEESTAYLHNHRMNAAAVALRASQDTGRGVDARRALRAKASAWFRAHVDAWARRIEVADAEELTGTLRGIARWRLLPAYVLQNAMAFGLEDAERETLEALSTTGSEVLQQATRALAEKGDPEVLARTLDPTVLVSVASAFLTAGRPAPALTLYEAAFEREPKLGRSAPPLYNAACAAVRLAGKEGTDPVRAASLRRKALAWVTASLHAYDAALEAGSDAAAIRKQIAWWTEDPDLASVRGDGIEDLPADERAGWAEFWSRIEKVLR